MAKSKHPAAKPVVDPLDEGLQLLDGHPVFHQLRVARLCGLSDCPDAPRHGFLTVDSDGIMHTSSRRASAEQWAWAVAHACLHLGFGHVPASRESNRPLPAPAERAAQCVVVDRFLAAVKVGAPPEHIVVETSSLDEEQLRAAWRRAGSVPAVFAAGGTAGGEPDCLLTAWRSKHRDPIDWPAEFGRRMSRAVDAAVDLAGGARMSMHSAVPTRQPWERALSWFVSSYPLLGALASGLKIVADREIAQAHGIWIAAVDASAGEIYINPLMTLTTDEWRFVLAHEMLHAALRHGDRVGGRDRYLWNVAADYVINGWLVEMRLGAIPDGCLYDPELAGCSAEEVYDRIRTDLRRLRRIRTMRGKGVGDILDEPLHHPGKGTSDLDDFYRRALLTGFEYHKGQDRGFLPAGLEQEIRALEHPPLKWDAQLARWFDEFLPRPEPARSYARLSRRQSATPDIPRPGRHHPYEAVPRVTFGVLLDTSASMNARMLGKALGAIASYATARDVPAARLVFCDAAPHDAGYVPVEDIAGRVRVKGRGGTVLQPAVRLLQKAKDFPPDAPILVITDGDCDVLDIRREHAFLLPAGKRLPFKPRGPVFEFR